MAVDLIQKLPKLPDAYDVRARLTPALLALTPVVAIVIGIYRAEMKLNAAVMSLFGFLGIFYLLSTLCREMGKRQEARLFAQWGGMPAMQLLRHRDVFLDAVTKARYHRFLEKWLEVPFPSPGLEQSAPEAADEVYRSGVRWLLGKARDKSKFSMLFNENISYGFRRNCYGIRWIAICISSLSVLWILAVGEVVSLDGLNLMNIVHIGLGAKVALIISLANILIWGFFFTEKTVRTASISYADILLRSCDMLSKKR